MLERLKRLNIFARIAELEKREEERDKALELMLIHNEAIAEYLDKRIKKINEQNKKISNMFPTYNLDLKSDLDVT